MCLREIDVCAGNRLSCNLLQANGVEGSHLIDAACEVLSAPSLAEVFWEMVRQNAKGRGDKT